MEETPPFRVLVVDDDEDHRYLAQRRLELAGITVATARNAEEALRSLDGVDIVLLDHRLPGMSGLDLLRHLVATGSHIPAIILTAHADDETRRLSLEAGAAAFLEKPFRSAALLDAVRAALSSA